MTGCSSSGANTRWWNPGTWFSGSAGRATDRAEIKLDAKREQALAAAHIEVAKTGEALDVAPSSRAVELAKRFNDNADTLLTQSVGAITAKDLQDMRQLVDGLMSENAAIRTDAEARQKGEEKKQAAISAELAEAQRKLSEAQGDLRQAFDRENALANQLRNQRFILWGLAGTAILLAVAWAYVRYIAGGLPSALGHVLAAAERKSPQLADDFRSLLDTHLNRHEQTNIASHYIRAK
jgi:hypothetical protein